MLQTPGFACKSTRFVTRLAPQRDHSNARPPRFSHSVWRLAPREMRAQAHGQRLPACLPPCPHISASWGMSSPNKGRHLHPASGAHPGLTTQVCGLMPHIKSPQLPNVIYKAPDSSMQQAVHSDKLGVQTRPK